MTLQSLMKYHSPVTHSRNIKKNTETHSYPTRDVIMEQPLICHVVPPFECSEGIVSVPMLVLLCISQQLYSFRSSHQRFSIKKCVLRSFAKFTGKHLCQSLLFNKVAGLKPATFIKKRLWHRCFPVNFANFPRAPFLQKKSGLLFLQFYLSLSLRNIVFFCD